MWRRLKDMLLFSISLKIGSDALDNLAKNKSASMSTTYGSYVAGNAVDGNTAQTFGSGSCSSTDPDAYAVVSWWRVDLGEKFDIHTIKIYFRNEETLYRSREVDVYVTNTTDVTSSTPCYEGLESDPPPVVTVETCKRIGRYVTVYKYRESCKKPYTNINFCSILELCEVEVLGCLQGKYGSLCENDCPSQCKNNLCGINTGECNDGCKDGYQGRMCSSTCNSGFYGTGCASSCGKCRDISPCDYVTGNCTDGCADGWINDLCNTPCAVGFYGPQCAHECQTCLNNACDTVDRRCQSGCKDGWTGDFCNSTCPAGSYGNNCSSKCGNCNINSTCDYVTGNCTAGCADGWKGDMCIQTCNIGFYGPKCVHECQNCTNNECHSVDGNCTNGCKTGWTGDFCQSKVKCNISDIYIVNSQVSQAFQSEVVMNESVTMTCKKGYNQTGGDKIRTCTEAGIWNGTTLNCSMCKCPCRNPILPNDTEALATWTKQMREDLTWDPKNTSKFRRTRISADDNSMVSKTIGVTLGIGVLAFVAAILVLPDIPRLVRDFRCKTHYHKMD